MSGLAAHGCFPSQLSVNNQSSSPSRTSAPAWRNWDMEFVPRTLESGGEHLTI